MTLEDKMAELTERLARAEAEMAAIKAPAPVRRAWRRKRRLLAAALTAGLLAVSAAYVGIAAAEPVPQLFTYRGVLEKDGVPVDASVNMTFSWFGGPSGSDPIGEAVAKPVQVTEGNFSVDLAMPSGDDSTAGGLYLSVEVDGEPLAGRQQVMSVPYALRAQRADSADSATRALDGVLGDDFWVQSLTVAGVATFGDQISAPGASVAGQVTASNVAASTVSAPAGITGGNIGIGTAGTWPYETISMNAGENLRINFGADERLLLTNAGDLSVPNNARGSCVDSGWIDSGGKQNNDKTAGFSDWYLCPAGYFMAGIQVLNSTNDVQKVDQVQVRCCGL